MDNIIRDFTIIEQIEGYDKENNPLKLSVYDLLPVGIKWNFNEQKYKIQNGNRVIAKLLNDKKHIAVVEILDNDKLNEAYIIDGNNIQKYNIRNLLNKDTLIFYDVYYEGEELYFYVIVENETYRFSFNVETGNIGKLIISK